MSNWPDESDRLSPLLNRRSIRKYSDEPISESMISLLIGCAQSSATSSNLQLWSVVTVQEPERRARIAKLCDDQAQVHRAPWFLAFIADHYRLRKAASQSGELCEGLDYMEFLLMAALDASLAAERLCCAADLMGIGSCYIGALRNHPQEVADLLELPTGTAGLFGLCLGKPLESDVTEVKPRLPQEAVWFREKYFSNQGIGDFDERMREFYESQGMSSDPSWSGKSGKRVDGSDRSLTGRGVLNSWLKLRGFARR